MRIEDLPALNASLNSIAALLLFLGRQAIKQGLIGRHRIYMLSAFGVSSLFLCSYLIYHFNVVAVTRYAGPEAFRLVYYFILFTHIPLATLMIPFIFWALVLAIRRNFLAHARLTRWLWPVWMYVSVTGVVIYLMLYQL